MSFAHYVKAISARALDAEEAEHLFAAMLDGGIPELELGALITALRVRGEATSELVGFFRALSMRVLRLSAPERTARPIAIASYGGTRHGPNLTALVALLLRRMAVPVLVHGSLEGGGRASTAHVFRELGIPPCSTLAQAQAAIDEDGLAFVPTGVFAPGLASLLALRHRLGVRNASHSLVKLVDPFGGDSVRLVAATDPGHLSELRAFVLQTGERAVILRGTEGEPFAHPRRRPRIELVVDGEARVLFEQENAPDDVLEQDEAADPVAAANYTRRVLAGRCAVPLPIVHQLACCLFAAGGANDFNQAKAIAAVGTHQLTV